ncbi:MAG: hypothetical protein KAU29_06065, partial [Gammaproteobacteria bacterium]|nr:hypothetical protein [Gammaproteobacteria bacterium]
MKQYIGMMKFVAVAMMVIVMAVFALWLAPVKPVVLWTDRLIYILIIAIAAFFTYVRSKEHLITPWRHVVRRPLAVVALVMLSAYVVVGLLDSVHFRQALEQSSSESSGESSASSKETHYSVDVESLLDIIADPIRKNIEKSYSAPLAAHLYTKDTVEQEDGSTIREYPRLLHGGAHLQNPAIERIPDITKRVAVAVLEAFIIWVIVVMLFIAVFSSRNQLKISDCFRTVVTGKTDMPWRS